MDLPEIPLPDGLADGVFAAILASKMKRLRMQLLATGVAFVAVVSFTISAISSLVAELRVSSSVAYFRLLWSDSDIVLQNAKAYLTGALEVIPVSSIILSLGTVLLLLALIAYGQAFLHSRQQAHRHVRLIHVM
jgi:hypothetical protein